MEGSKLVPIMIDSGRKISKSEPAVEPRTFSQYQLLEEHVETFLDGNLDVLFAGDPDAQSLLQVGRQVPNEYKGECDLVALDSNGCLVIIEIKRDPKDARARVEAFEIQAIRYASSFMRISTPEELVEQVYAPYLMKYQSEELAGNDAHIYATGKMNDFLRGNKCRGSFNNKQRIILVASGFDPETKSACAWLVKNGIDVSCIQISPLEHSGHSFLLVERIIPPPALEEMLSKVTTRKVVRPVLPGNGGERPKKAKLPTTQEMFEQGQLKAGDTVIIKDRPNSTATVVDYRYVSYQDKAYSWNAWAKEITKWSAVNIYANVMMNGKTLDELRGNTDLEGDV